MRLNIGRWRLPTLMKFFDTLKSLSARWRHCLAFVAALVAVWSAFAAQAAEWPTRPVRIIAPSTPGGAADSIGRLVGDPLSELTATSSISRTGRAPAA